MAIGIVPLRDELSLCAMHVCVRQLSALPAFAHDRVVDSAHAPGQGQPSQIRTSPRACSAKL